jgi:hypothetical protein
MWLTATLSTKPRNIRVRSLKRRWRRWVQRSERGAAELKAALLQRFAAQYVTLSVPYGHQLHRPTRPSDQYMALFNTALAEALVRLFFNTFHKSAAAGTFDESFQRSIQHQILEWTSGT